MSKAHAIFTLKASVFFKNEEEVNRLIFECYDVLNRLEKGCAEYSKDYHDPSAYMSDIPPGHEEIHFERLPLMLPS